DLTTRQISSEPLRREWIRQYWGSWGLALRYYWDLVEPSVDPLSAENAIVIMTGPFSGTLVPLTSRLSLVSKSPHTGTIFTSNVGGAFGPELKFAGYDGLIIKGAADSPVYLKIVDDQVSLEDASAMMGKGIFETEALLEEAVGELGAKTLAIGPAGEKQITYSMIGSESYRQFGRGGTGALFGSKNLKGVICRGSKSVQVADMPKFIERITHHKTENLFTEDNLWANSDGTAVLVDVTNEMGIHPTKNYTAGINERKGALNSDAIKAAKISDRACAGCPLACGKFTRIGDAEIEGPEYETLCLGGSNCEINDLEAIIKFNRVCDDLGLDTMSCGSTISMAMEMTESGRHDFGIRFGDGEEYLKLVEEIATLSTERGRDLAMGAKKLAEKYASSDLSMEVKGLEMPAYEPRGNYGMGLAYATSERGACHLRAFTIFSETPFDIDVQVQDVINGQNFNAIKWSMCYCDFWGSINTDVTADLLSVGLGEEVTAAELDLAGERIWNLSRLFNLHNGFGSADDRLPEKVLKNPLKHGPNAGKTFAPEDFSVALRSYYQKRGWDEQGQPGAAKLAELGLDQL
ncbi:MAG: aldehyde ferredoxin oxidoreductase family protein, partial [Desulfuromonadales bacterium]|nr:aldehyde ferredoxin oxidoreductase family protein [Desulfuromonadales bacterium]